MDKKTFNKIKNSLKYACLVALGEQVPYIKHIVKQANNQQDFEIKKELVNNRRNLHG